jgi:uncharacterized protein (DUF1778 family)
MEATPKPGPSPLTYGNLPYMLKVITLVLILYKSAAMTHVTDSKSSARLEARISQETKALIQKAADLEGRTLTDFVVASVQATAYRVIEHHQTLKLGIEDSEAFVDAILNPTQPNKALKSAALRYQQTISV